MNLRCILDHASVDKGAEKVGDFAFMYEQCSRCKMYRTTVIGFGGTSTKKWESEEKFLEYRRKAKEMDERMEKSLEDLRKLGEYRDKELKGITANYKEVGQATGRDLTDEAKRRHV